MTELKSLVLKVIKLDGGEDKIPIYEWSCEDCDNKVTVKKVNFEPGEPPKCSICGETMQQSYGAAVHYKGPGFYTTDSRGITGKKRKPNVKVGHVSDLSPEEQERALG